MNPPHVNCSQLPNGPLSDHWQHEHGPGDLYNWFIFPRQDAQAKLEARRLGIRVSPIPYCPLLPPIAPYCPLYYLMSPILFPYASCPLSPVPCPLITIIVLTHYYYTTTSTITPLILHITPLLLQSPLPPL
jgi:hypothetical protein